MQKLTVPGADGDATYYDTVRQRLTLLTRTPVRSVSGREHTGYAAKKQQSKALMYDQNRDAFFFTPVEQLFGNEPRQVHAMLFSRDSVRTPSATHAESHVILEPLFPFPYEVFLNCCRVEYTLRMLYERGDAELSATVLFGGTMQTFEITPRQMYEVRLKEVRATVKKMEKRIAPTVPWYRSCAFFGAQRGSVAPPAKHDSKFDSGPIARGDCSAKVKALPRPVKKIRLASDSSGEEDHHPARTIHFIPPL